MKLLLLDNIKEFKSNYGDDGSLEKVYWKINDVFSMKEFLAKEGEDVDLYVSNILDREGVGKDNELVFKKENHGATFNKYKPNNMSQEYEVEVNLGSDEADFEFESEYESENQNNLNQEDYESNVENEIFQDYGSNEIVKKSNVKKNEEEEEKFLRWLEENKDEFLETMERLSLEIKTKNQSDVKKEENKDAVVLSHPTFRLLSQFSLNSPLNNPLEVDAPVIKSPYVNRRFIPTSTRILYSELVVALNMFSSITQADSFW